MVKKEAVARRCSVKKVFSKISQNAEKNLCRSLCFLGLQVYYKRNSGTGVFLWIFQFFLRNIFLRNTSGGCFCKDYQLKSISQWRVYVTIHSMCCLVVQELIHACGGFKKKRLGKKVARSTKAAKKTWGFCSKYVLPTSRF